MSSLAALQQVLGVTFRNMELLKQALVHPSFLNENPGFPLPSSERLEFLGDAVLGLVAGERLYQKLPELTEGNLTKMRSALVCQETLRRLATELHLGDHLYLGQGEDSSGGRSKPSNLASALEAVIGAIYLDLGLEAARDFTLRLLGDEIERQSPDAPIDYKSQLQEFLHSRRRQTPTYRVAQTGGPDHEKTFTVEVLEGDAVRGRGTGQSKKNAEMAAARVALEELQKDAGQREGQALSLNLHQRARSATLSNWADPHTSGGDAMSSRDYRWREKKKPKKDTKKLATIPPITQSVEVEVVRKHRKKEEEAPEE